MQQADGRLFGVLADSVCREALHLLLESEDGLTQRELASSLGIPSGTASKKMRELEVLGLVSRPSSHRAYSVVFPGRTRAFLDEGAEFAATALEWLAEEARAHARDLRKGGMAGGNLRDRAKEGLA